MTSTTCNSSSFNPFKAIGDAVGGAFGAVARALDRECGRIVNEVAENIGKDAQQIAKGIESGGLLGGLVETFDVLSPGHQIANFLDATNVIPENIAVQEGVSAAANLLSGNALAGFKDIADAIAAFGSPAVGARRCSPPPNASQTPMHPNEAHERRKDAVRIAVEAARDRAAAHSAARDGYCGDASPGRGTYHDCMVRWWANAGAPSCEQGSAGDGAVDDAERRMSAEINRILNNPCLDFEDMIFHLMRAVIKGTQAQAKAMTKALTAEAKDARQARTQGSEAVISARRELRRAEAAGNRDGVARAEATLERLQLNNQNSFEARTESRNDKMEVLKNILQKLSEMQQALSNVLNAQHETAMATVRAIR